MFFMNSHSLIEVNLRGFRNITEGLAIVNKRYCWFDFSFRPCFQLVKSLNKLFGKKLFSFTKIVLVRKPKPEVRYLIVPTINAELLYKEIEGLWSWRLFKERKIKHTLSIDSTPVIYRELNDLDDVLQHFKQLINRGVVAIDIYCDSDEFTCIKKIGKTLQLFVMTCKYFNNPGVRYVLLKIHKFNHIRNIWNLMERRFTLFTK